jgi:hypothetical protein
MKILHLLLILCAACALTVNGQATPRSSRVEMSYGLDPLYAQLELTKDLIELRYCSDDRLEFVVRLNFSNKGEGPVVLERRWRSSSAYLVSRTFENAIKKKYEFIVHKLRGYDPTDLVPDESSFILLKPGESYSLEQTLRLNNRKSMRAGHHVLQMVVDNWPYLRASNIEWRERFRNRGYLWTDSTTSVPMPFMLAKKATIVECPRE